MDAITEYLNRLIKLEQNSFKLIFDAREVKDEIIRLVTVEQLYERGVDGNGESLGEYSEFTKQIKQLEGQRFDHITLNDTGEVYESFEVIVGQDSFTITANDNKGDKRLFDVYGEDVAGLTDESFDDLFLTIRDIVYDLLISIQV